MFEFLTFLVIKIHVLNKSWSFYKKNDVQLVEKLVWRKPSREVRVQTLQEIAQEAKISWDSLSKGSLSSSSSLSSKRRESVKKIFPYKKQGAQNDEQGHDEKKEKSTVQEKSRLRGPQGSASLTSTSSNEVSSTKDYKRKSLFQRPKILDYDEVVARLADLRRS